MQVLTQVNSGKADGMTTTVVVLVRPNMPRSFRKAGGVDGATTWTIVRLLLGIIAGHAKHIAGTGLSLFGLMFFFPHLFPG